MRRFSFKMDRKIYLSTLGEILQNWLALSAIILLGAALYSLIPWTREYFAFSYTLGILQFGQAGFFSAIILIYLLLLLPYYATIPSGAVTKSVRIWRWLSRGKLDLSDNSDRIALLATLLKGYYIPLMLVALLFHCTQMAENFIAWIQTGGFFPEGYWAVYRLIMAVDVICFTFGYMIEHPTLGNEIISVDSTKSGWVATMICYPPLNGFTTVILGNYTTTYPQWYLGNGYALFSAVAMLLLLVIYASAAVFLNLRTSNLTFRGVVDKGPYALVRHPDYTTKIFSWWIGSLPIFWMQYSNLGTGALLQGLGGLFGWTAIYVMRAVTEERHLKKVSTEYRLYCLKVRYRFIPGLI